LASYDAKQVVPANQGHSFNIASLKHVSHSGRLYSPQEVFSSTEKQFDEIQGAYISHVLPLKQFLFL
jgi:lipopolysaccharide biosynthesis protein